MTALDAHDFPRGDREGDLEQLRMTLTRAPGTVNARDAAGRKSTPLHFAAGFGRVDLVAHLLAAGADVEASDEGGLLPLHNACSFGHVDVVALLVKANAPGKHLAGSCISNVFSSSPLFFIFLLRGCEEKRTESARPEREGGDTRRRHKEA